MYSRGGDGTAVSGKGAGLCLFQKGIELINIISH